jgi:RNA polymerase sigma factor (sigma-70 family)
MGHMSHDQSAFLASLAAIRGFVTSSELARTSPAEFVRTEEDPLERLYQRSADRSLDEGPGTKLELLTRLRVEVIARCVVGLVEADREWVAQKLKISVEDLPRVQANVVTALTLPEAERGDALARCIDALSVADLVSALRERRLWPGDPEAPHVRGYLQALADTVAQHARLAFWAATRWVRQPSRQLLLAALDGLAEAIERFDPKRGCRLGTYAPPWIRQRVQRALWNSGMPVRMPVHLVDQFTKVRRQAMRIVVREGRSPTLAEIVESLPGVARSEQALPVALSSLGDVWEVRRPDGELEFQHLFDEQHVTRARVDLRRSLMAMVLEISFKGRTRDVLWRRFRLGAADAAEETLEEIGESYGITRERIRQVERDGLDLLARTLGGRLAHLRKRRADH